MKQRANPHNRYIDILWKFERKLDKPRSEWEPSSWLDFAISWNEQPELTDIGQSTRLLIAGGTIAFDDGWVYHIVT